MKISTKGRYALRLMADLAQHSDGESLVKIKEVADRQNISLKYLEQIVAGLNRAGLVKSVRGAQGGYRLNRPSEEYTAGMILRAIEGDLAPVACMEDEKNQCGRSSECVTLPLWEKLDVAITQVVDLITLADLIANRKPCNTTSVTKTEMVE